MILCSGCFDGLHAGHVAYLASARQLGQPLIVAVAPDAYIRGAKGREPHWPQHERALAVAALRVVDYVLMDEDVADIIRERRPTYFVKGADWNGKLPAAVTHACQQAGTHVVYVPTDGTHVSEARG